jgi:hypothetical protein
MKILDECEGRFAHGCGPPKAARYTLCISARGGWGEIAHCGSPGSDALLGGDDFIEANDDEQDYVDAGDSYGVGSPEHYKFRRDQEDRSLEANTLI